MLGLRKSLVIFDILINTFVFVLPGIVAAFVLSFVALELIFYYAFEQTLNLKMSSTPTFTAVLNGLFVGLLIPFISAILPIQEALSKNLNEALDYTRSKTKGVIISIVKSENQHTAIILVLGTVSVVYGIAIYIYLPQSMLQLNLGLMLLIFFMILIGLLLGLVLIALNFLHLI